MKIKDLKPCELCGKYRNLLSAIIEGTMMSVCNECAKFGNINVIEKKELKEIKPRKIYIEEKIIEEINPNYSSLIKEAREKMNLKQEELAKKISEKESVIHSLESGALKPQIELAKKLENFLNIKLIEKYGLEEKNKVDLSDPSLTIGDLLKLKKK